ncbi:permease prefix domain 1-containing protein [Peribacillus frigoritolerans]|uniref:permease prefix domain 1-containing protein n=1 Tax=Peribacillus frigoritolerans TaxID=450367 RepID=UPI003D006E5E
MKQIEDYVNSIYRNVDGDKKEIQDLKDEMRLHLLESVQELRKKGKSEEEAACIAIENFGGKKLIVKELSEFFSIQKQLARYILGIAIISLIIGFFFLANTILDIKEFREERPVIMNDVLNVLENTIEVSDSQKTEIITIYKKHHKHLNKLAVFNIDQNTSLQHLLKENINLKNEPINIYPIKYKDADFVIGNKGIITNKEDIVSSTYDLGTVAQANDNWVVQYEYSDSYKNIIEKENLSKLGTSYMELYQLPILFFIMFSILMVVWIFLKKNNNLLRGIIRLQNQNK